MFENISRTCFRIFRTIVDVLDVFIVFFWYLLLLFVVVCCLFVYCLFVYCFFVVLFIVVFCFENEMLLQKNAPYTLIMLRIEWNSYVFVLGVKKGNTVMKNEMFLKKRCALTRWLFCVLNETHRCLFCGVNKGNTVMANLLFLQKRCALTNW